MRGETIGWGILGCGNFLRRRVLPVFPQVPDARAVALQRRSLDAAQQTARELGVPRAYASRDELLRDPEVQAVFVSSHHAGHLDDVVAAARAGKHILCEKPLGMNAGECRHMVDACRAAGVRLFVGHCGRYRHALERARELLAAGALGQLRSLYVCYVHRAKQGTWRRDARLSGGGPLLDLGPHVIDTVRWLSGSEVAEVTAVTEPERNLATGQCEERARAFLKLRSGVMAVIELSYEEPLRADFEVRGSEAHLRAPYVLSNMDSPLVSLTRYWGDPGPIQAEAIPLERRDIYARQLADVTRALLDPRYAPRCATGEDGVRTLEIVDAIYASSREGRKVTFVAEG